MAIDGSTLTDARIASGLSLDEVAAAIKVNKGTLSRWERSLFVPPAEKVLEMMVLYKADNGIVKK